MRKTHIWQSYDHYACGAVATLGTLAAIAMLGWLMTTAFWTAWGPQMAQISSPF